MLSIEKSPNYEFLSIGVEGCLEQFSDVPLCATCYFCVKYYLYHSCVIYFLYYIVCVCLVCVCLRFNLCMCVCMWPYSGI